MATICITGSTDGIGLATARVLVDRGHRVLVHARNAERGRAVVDTIGGSTVLVTGDLSRRDEIRGLADQIRAHGPLDTLVHNAGVWVRGDDAAATEDGVETTFAVNVLAAHLLTHLLASDLRDRMIWLGSGRAAHGRIDTARLGAPQDASQAYADSKAADVALALAWDRRLPGIASVAVDPGWVRTKLATAGAPGDAATSARTVASCATTADLAQGGYWRDERPIPVPPALLDHDLQDRLAAACDRMLGIA